MTVEPSNIASSGTKVEINISLYTTSRQSSFLFIDFGDGHHESYTLHDSNMTSNMTSKDGNSSEQSGLQLVASYGVGCTLHMRVFHIYDREGQYGVVAQAQRDDSTVKASSKTVITVMNKLRDAHIYAEKTVTVNTSTDINVRFGQDSMFKSLTWKISHADQPLEVSITNSTTLHHRFSRTGLWRIDVDASNVLGRSSAEYLVNVQQPIRALQVHSSQHVIQTGQEISFKASVQDGTNVKFTWDFGLSGKQFHHVSNSQQMSAARVTYAQPGTYSVTLTAENELGSSSDVQEVIVQSPIAGLVVDCPSHVVAGKQVTITAAVARGSHAEFLLTDDKRNITMASSETTASINHTFLTSGKQSVSVLAYNHVSSQTESMFVTVLEEFGELTVGVVGEASAKEVTAFIAKLDGRFIIVCIHNVFFTVNVESYSGKSFNVYSEYKLKLSVCLMVNDIVLYDFLSRPFI